MPTVSEIHFGTPLAEVSVGGVALSYAIVGGTTDPTPPLTNFPTASTVGVDAIPGWAPTTTITDQPDNVYFVDEEGALFEDYRFLNTTVIVRAAHVTFRRCEIIGGFLLNFYFVIGNDLMFEDSTIRYLPAGTPGAGAYPGASSIGICGFTMLRSAVVDVNEGVRSGGSASAGIDLADPGSSRDINIIDSFIRIMPPQPYVPGFDYHGDAWQCSDSGLPEGGVKCIIRNSRFESNDVGFPLTGGNSCITDGPGHCLPFDIDGLILGGAGYTMYHRIGGDYSNMYFVDDSWYFGPIVTDDLNEVWDTVDTWDNIAVCTLDAAGQPDVITGYIPFGYNGGPFDPP